MKNRTANTVVLLLILSAIAIGILQGAAEAAEALASLASAS